MKPKITIGIPAGSHVVFDFAISLARLAAYYSESYQLDNIIYAQGCYLHDNRNRMVSNFLATDSEWLLQIDTDIVFDINIIDNLLALANRKNSKFVSAWYMNIVQGKYIPMLYTEKENQLHYVLPSLGPDIQVDACGLACVMIHREVFEKLNNGTSQGWFYFIEKNNKLVSEDLTFSLNARQAEYEIWVDSNLKLKHMKLGDI